MEPAAARVTSGAAGAAGPVKASRNPLAASGWSGVGFIVSNIVGVVASPLLARRLGQDDFGLFAEVNLVYLAVVLLSEGTILQALVQMRGDRARLGRAGLWLSLMLGLLGGALCVAAGPVMARIYDDAELTPLLLLMAPSVVISALGAVPHALLARELDFRRKALPEALAVFAGGVATIAAAFAGMGVYALALGASAGACASTGAAWWVCRPRPRFSRPDRDTMRRMSGFAVTLSGGELAVYARLNTDTALTGRLLGSGALGVYTIAWGSSSGPQAFINAFTSRVGYALFAQLQHDRARLRAVFLAGLRIVAAAALPVSLCSIVLARDIVIVLLGSKWEAAVAPLMVLFLLQLVRTVCGPGASLLLALGRARLYSTVGLAMLPLTLVGVLVGTRGGITGVAIAMLIAVGGASLVYLLIALRMLAIRGAELAQSFIVPAALTVATVPPVALTRAVFAVAGAPEPVRLSAAIVAGIAAAFFTLRRVRSSLHADLRLIETALPEEGADPPHERPVPAPAPDAA